MTLFYLVLFQLLPINYFYVSFNGLLISFGEERVLVFLLSISRNIVVSVRRGFFLLLGIGYVI